MICLNKMGQLVHDDVVDDKHWCLNQPPIEVDIVLRGARPPAVPTVDDLGQFELHTKIVGMLFDAWQDILTCLGNVPITHCIFPSCCVRSRHYKPLVELDVTQPALMKVAREELERESWEELEAAVKELKKLRDGDDALILGKAISTLRSLTESVAKLVAVFESDEEQAAAEFLESMTDGSEEEGTEKVPEE